MLRPSNDPLPGTPLSDSPDRLDSWKEIAAYLHRSVSTVQRWEQEERLPVHRLVHSKGGSVYALKRELDGWIGEHEAHLADVPRLPAIVERPRPPTPSRSWTGALIVVLLALAVLIVLLVAFRPSASPEPIVRARLDVSPAEELNAGGSDPVIDTVAGSRTALRWTPNEDALVFVGRRKGTQQLYVRYLAEIAAVALEGTEGAQVPVVSPDGRWIVFWSGGEIRRVPRVGGPIQTLVRNVEIAPAGMALAPGGQVYFSAGTPAGEPLTESIWTTTPDGVVTLVTRHLPGELAHLAPQVVSDGRVLLFTVRRTGTWGREQVVAERLPIGARTVLLDDAADARYDAESRLLVFIRRGQVLAAPLDLASLRITGPPIAIAEPVAQAMTSSNGIDITGAGQFDVDAGRLAFVRGSTPRLETRPIIAVDRTGAVTRLGFEPQGYETLDLSADGTRIAVAAGTLTERALFVGDLARGTLTKLPDSGEPTFPRWSPDGRWIAFLTLRNGAWALARQRSDGTSGPEVLLSGVWCVSSWSPDGRWLVAVHDADIWTIDLSGSKPSPRQLIRSEDRDGSPAVSPDGRWLAFASTMNGHREVFVRPFPADGPVYQVSVGGGANPAWADGGRELLFLQGTPGSAAYRMVSVSLSGLHVGLPHPLFTVPPGFGPCVPNACFAVSRDGRRFYAAGEPAAPAVVNPVSHVELVLNWPRLLEAGSR